FNTDTVETYLLFHKGLIKAVPEGSIAVYYNYAVSILAILVLLLTLITVFSFRNRLLQIRLCGIVMFLLVVIVGSALWQFVQTAKSFSHYSLKIAFFFPAVSILLVWFARKFIRRDEELVRSVDRIR
ncbi:MAG: DUF4293 domain-containing protein, partial [Bacteroidales bacterium]